jgi:hypothetical protein
MNEGPNVAQMVPINDRADPTPVRLGATAKIGAKRRKGINPRAAHSPRRAAITAHWLRAVPVDRGFIEGVGCERTGYSKAFCVYSFKEAAHVGY